MILRLAVTVCTGGAPCCTHLPPPSTQRSRSVREIVPQSCNVDTAVLYVVEEVIGHNLKSS